MVALTASFEPVAVQTLIEKMEDIRDSLLESVKIEDEAEAKNQRVDLFLIYILGQRCYFEFNFQCY
jgi:hypothetical protein